VGGEERRGGGEERRRASRRQEEGAQEDEYEKDYDWVAGEDGRGGSRCRRRRKREEREQEDEKECNRSRRVADEYGGDGRGDREEDGGGGIDRNNYTNLHFQLSHITSLVACPIDSKTGFSNTESLEHLSGVQGGTDL
jgi:hypothetical protein